MQKCKATVAEENKGTKGVKQHNNTPPPHHQHTHTPSQLAARSIPGTHPKALVQNNSRMLLKNHSDIITIIICITVNYLLNYKRIAHILVYLPTMSSLLASTPVELTQAGRPVMQAGEVEMRSEGGVDVYQGPQQGQAAALLLSSCVVSLTNYRLLFIDGSCGMALGLESADRIEDMATIFRSSKRFRIYYTSKETLELKFVEGIILLYPYKPS
jgi:hypothetical protein